MEELIHYNTHPDNADTKVPLVYPPSDSAHGSTPNNEIEVVLTRTEGGWGMTLIGPKDDDLRDGVFVTKVKEGSPAKACGKIEAGMRILQVGTEDVSTSTKSDTISRIKACGNTLPIKFALASNDGAEKKKRKEEEGEAVSAATSATPKDAGASSDQVHKNTAHNKAPQNVQASSDRKSKGDSNESPAKSAPWFRVTLKRSGEEGWGMSLVGPSDAETLAQKPGIFVSKVKPDTPAARCGKIKRGQRLLAVAAIDVAMLTRAQAIAAIKSCTTELPLVLGVTGDTQEEGTRTSNTATVSSATKSPHPHKEGEHDNIGAQDQHNDSNSLKKKEKKGRHEDDGVDNGTLKKKKKKKEKEVSGTRAKVQTSVPDEGNKMQPPSPEEKEEIAALLDAGLITEEEAAERLNPGTTNESSSHTETKSPAGDTIEGTSETISSKTTASELISPNLAVSTSNPDEVDDSAPASLPEGVPMENIKGWTVTDVGVYVTSRELTT